MQQKKGLLKLFIGLLMILMANYAVGNVDAVDLDKLIIEARLKAQSGDFERAALLYHQVLQMDKNNRVAARELSALLIENRVQDPYSEQTDTVTAIEEKMAEAPIASSVLPLTFLSNGSLTSKDASMSRQVLWVLNKLQTGENESAIKIVKALQEQNPEHPVPYNLLGLISQGIGEPSTARDYFLQALRLQKSFHAARINLAELEYYLGNFTKAEQELNRVLKADHHNRRAGLVIAQFYTLEGKPELAKQWYLKLSEHL